MPAAYSDCVRGGSRNLVRRGLKFLWKMFLQLSLLRTLFSWTGHFQFKGEGRDGGFSGIFFNNSVFCGPSSPGQVIFMITGAHDSITLNFIWQKFFSGSRGGLSL